jgi:hypothetical protein
MQGSLNTNRISIRGIGARPNMGPVELKPTFKTFPDQWRRRHDY